MCVCVCVVCVCAYIIYDSVCGCVCARVVEKALGVQCVVLVFVECVGFRV